MLERLPKDLLREVWSYDDTYREYFSKEVLPQMRRFFSVFCELLLLDYVPDSRITPRLRTFSKSAKRADLVSLARYLGVVLPRKSTKWRTSLRLLSALSGRQVPPPTRRSGY
jgi:hypothetical protein